MLRKLIFISFALYFDNLRFWDRCIIWYGISSRWSNWIWIILCPKLQANLHDTRVVWVFCRLMHLYKIQDINCFAMFDICNYKFYSLRHRRSVYTWLISGVGKIINVNILLNCNHIKMICYRNTPLKCSYISTCLKLVYIPEWNVLENQQQSGFKGGKMWEYNVEFHYLVLQLQSS